MKMERMEILRLILMMSTLIEVLESYLPIQQRAQEWKQIAQVL